VTGEKTRLEFEMNSGTLIARRRILAARGLGLFFFVFGLLGLSSHSFADTPNQSITDAMQQKLSDFKRQVARNTGEIPTRSLSSAALLSLMSGDDPSIAEDFLRRAYATQDMNPDSRTYGQLQWLISDTGITDLNAIDFNTLSLGPIYLRFGDQLSPDFKQEFKPHFAAALVGLHNHLVKVSYTNIWLMNSVCQLLLGHAADDKAAIAEAEHRLDQWIDFTRINGIHEFESPTYYGVDVNELTAGYHYAADPVDQRKFKTILDYFWTDIAANYFPQAHRLTGAFSRDYDFLSATGDLDIWLAAFNWIPTSEMNSFGLDGVFVLDNFRDGGYAPPQSAVDLANSGPREIVSAYDDDPMHARWNWIGPSVALGCTSGYYGEQDKLFSAMFAGPRKTPQIALIVDGEDSPYGYYRVRDKTNHPKAVHLAANFACVQSGSTALLTLDINPSKLPGYATSVSTNFVIPSEATVSQNGQTITASRADLDRNATITIADRAGIVSIRLLKAEPVDDVIPTWSYVTEVTGLAHNAARLRLMNLPAGHSTKQQHLRVAFLVSAAPIGYAAVDDRVANDHWQISVKSAEQTMAIDRSAINREKIFSEQIDGADVQRAILSVNGKDLATPIWNELNGN
jgi:hypothetical protein